MWVNCANCDEPVGLMTLTEHQRLVLLDFLNCTYIHVGGEYSVGNDYAYDSVVINEVLEEIYEMLKEEQG